MARKHLLANLGAHAAKPAEANDKAGSRVEYARRGASRSMMQSLDELAENSMRVLEGDTVVSLDPAKLDPSPYADRIGEDEDVVVDHGGFIRNLRLQRHDRAGGYRHEAARRDEIP